MKLFFKILFISGFFISFTLFAKCRNSSLNRISTVESIKNEIQNGDIIFQTSLSSQSIAIQQATKSKYSHCGIIYSENGKYYVFEAIQPVKLTKLEKWMQRGKDGKYVIKRLKNSETVLTKENIIKMKEIGNTFLGKSYDITFEWNDNKIYCSELIWKVYKRALGIEIGKLQELNEFDLTNKVVKQKMKERYGNKIPLHETVISPASIFESNLLETIFEN